MKTLFKSQEQKNFQVFRALEISIRCISMKIKHIRDNFVVDVIHSFVIYFLRYNFTLYPFNNKRENFSSFMLFAIKIRERALNPFYPCGNFG